MLDLLNAENELFQVRSSAETDRMEILQAQYRLLTSLAQLNTWLGIVTPATALSSDTKSPGTAK